MAQAYATLDEVINASTGIAPELSAFPAAQGAIWLDIAEQHVGIQRWQKRTSQGHMLLTAHLLTASVTAAGAGIGTGEAGPLTGDSVGPASRSFATAPVSDEALSTTVYGRQYLVLKRIIIGIGTAVVGNTAIRQKF